MLRKGEMMGILCRPAAAQAGYRAVPWAQHVGTHCVSPRTSTGKGIPRPPLCCWELSLCPRWASCPFLFPCSTMAPSLQSHKAGK